MQVCFQSGHGFLLRCQVGLPLLAADATPDEDIEEMLQSDVFPEPLLLSINDAMCAPGILDEWAQDIYQRRHCASMLVELAKMRLWSPRR